MDRTISAFLLEGAIKVCETDGIHADEVLASAGLKLENLRVPGARILRSQGVALIAAVANASSSESAAFRSGLYSPIGNSTELHEVFTIAKDVSNLVVPLNSALDGVCGGWVGLNGNGGEVRLSIGFPRWNITEEEPWHEAAAGALVAALRLRFGPDWLPIRVLVGHKRPRIRAIKCDGIDVILGAPDNAAIMTKQDSISSPHNLKKQNLDKAGNTAQTHLLADVENQTRLIIADRMALSENLLVGDTAKVLEISARTLKRRLKDEGVTFRSILEDVRICEAERLLRTTDISVVEIAQAVGYSHSSSFTRAFGKKNGQSPTQTRGNAMSGVQLEEI